MSPKRPAVRPVTPPGRVELSDIRSKLEEIRGDTDQTTERAKPYAVMGVVAGAVAVAGLAFLLGRRRGRRKSTWVEIRRL